MRIIIPDDYQDAVRPAGRLALPFESLTFEVPADQ
jgi:hypothetical protein